MLKFRKAKIKHTCLICSKEIEIKQKYIQMSKKQDDNTYKNGAICESCTEKLIISKIEGD